MINRKERRKFRHKRVRYRVRGTALRPRLSVFRSNRHIFVQLIDDEAGKTVAASSDIQPKKSKKKKVTPKKRASAVGELIAKIAKEKKITRVVFDRGGYTYHGLVKEVAEGARRGGLTF